MEQPYFVCKMVKKNGKLEFKQELDRLTMNERVKHLREGQVVEFMCDFNRDDGTLAQLAKVHQMIRVLSLETGVSNSTIKLRVKNEACLNLDGKVKSFKNCSKEEMASAIQAAYELGDFVGINLR